MITVQKLAGCGSINTWLECALVAVLQNSEQTE